MPSHYVVTRTPPNDLPPLPSRTTWYGTSHNGCDSCKEGGVVCARVVYEYVGYKFREGKSEPVYHADSCVSCRSSDRECRGPPGVKQKRKRAKTQVAGPSDLIDLTELAEGTSPNSRTKHASAKGTSARTSTAATGPPTGPTNSDFIDLTELSDSSEGPAEGTLAKSDMNTASKRASHTGASAKSRTQGASRTEGTLAKSRKEGASDKSTTEGVSAKNKSTTENMRGKNASDNHASDKSTTEGASDKNTPRPAWAYRLMKEKEKEKAPKEKTDYKKWKEMADRRRWEKRMAARQGRS